MAAGDDLSPGILPRVLIVSRRSVRKNKFVDFVGEYHLDLIVNYGAVPVIVPRVTGIHNLLESFEPIHGVLLCEGEDIDPSLYSFSTDDSFLSTEDLEEIKRLHTSDTTTDKEKDRIELRLAKLCLERTIPYLGICRGSQVLNVASGGTLYQDVRKELTGSRLVLPHDQGDDGDGSKKRNAVMHIDYDNYDGHRHALKIVKNTPLHHWFKESLGGACDDDDDDKKMEILVNSYHHQGVKRLASRFVAMGFAEDGLIEGFYDPNTYDPEQGKFVVGLQFHPERMRKPDSDEFDYPGCPSVYMEFVKAVTAYKRKQEIISKVPRSVKQQLFRSQETLEKKRKLATNPSYALAEKDIYVTRICLNLLAKDDDDDDDELIIETAAVPELFVEYSNSSRCNQGNQQQGYRSRLIQMVRNGTFPYMDYKLRLGEESEIGVTREIMEMMSVEQLTDLMAFYHMMDQISSDVLQRKVGGINCK